MKNTKVTETAPLTWTKAMQLLDMMRDKDQDNTRLMIASGFFFGLRISDILKLRWQDVTGDYFTLIEKKTKKERKIAIHSDYKKILRQVKETLTFEPHPNNYIFTDQRGKADSIYPIKINAANYRIKAAFEKYDIKAQKASSHTLRKTFGRRIYENNNRSESALVLLSQIFKHSSIATTRRYIGLTAERIEHAYLSL